MNNMPNDGVINKPPAQPLSQTHTQRFRVSARPPPDRTGQYTSHEGVADLTLKRVQEARLTQGEIANLSIRGGQVVTYAKNILRNAVVEEDRLAHFVCDSNGKPVDIDAIRESLIWVSEFAPSARFNHPEGGTDLHLSVAVLYCNEPVGRRFLLSNAPISVLGTLEKATEPDIKFYSCITGRRSITLAGRPGEYRHLYLATAEIERMLNLLCSRYPATDSTLSHLDEMKPSSGSAPVIDLPILTQGQEDGFQSVFRGKAPVKKVATPPADGAQGPAEPGKPEMLQPAPQPVAPAVPEAAGEGGPVPERRIMANMLGITLEDLEGRQKVDNADELRRSFSNPKTGFVFKGLEVELTQDGVKGMRLIMTPVHPSTLADQCPAMLGYADTARFMAVAYPDGRKIYYYLVKPQPPEGRVAGFSLSPMENTFQVFEDTRQVETPSSSARLPEPFASPPPREKAEAAAPAIQEAGAKAPAMADAGRQPPVQFEFPARPPAPALPETAHPAEEARDEIPSEAEPPREAALPSGAEQALEEKFDEVRKFAYGIMGNSPASPEEAVFGESIAILVQSGSRHYLVTDAEDWNAARKAMEEHLSSGAEGTMLTEIQSAYARKKMHLASGGDVTVFVKPVGKSKVHTGERGESHSDTLEMMPGKAVDAAIAQPENAPSPEQQRWRARAIDLIRGASLPLSRADDEAVLDLFMEPDSIVDAMPGPERYIIAKTSKGGEYALFSFPCKPEEMNPDISEMSAALVFTNPSYLGYSLLLMETKFLTPGLTEMILANWKASR